MNRKELLKWAVAETGAEKRLEAELLFCHVLDTNRASLLAHDDEPVTGEEENQYRDYIQRYRDGEPLQYLLGTTSFMGLDYYVSPAVLIPRFDTEKVTEKGLQLIEKTEQPVILDCCTGSGAIAVAISHYRPDAVVFAGDLSGDALEVAERNSKTLCEGRVQFRQGDLLEPFDDLKEKLDLLVSNPPYITSEEMRELPADVLSEPHMALWGGEDGLVFYRRLAEEGIHLLKAGGWIALEVGFRQGDAVAELLQKNGYSSVEILKDWQNLDRVVCGKKPLYQ